MSSKKTKLINHIIIFIVFTILIAVITLSILYFKYIHKENNLVLYMNGDNTQKIYILGTIHEYHFKSYLNYSYLDVQNVIENIRPDLLLLEVDQETYNEYGVVKSPVEMIPLWCYALEEGMSVKGVDWFEVTEKSRSWTTNKERDDHIFENIMASVENESTVLIILGSTHRIEQANRFENSGYKKHEIFNKPAFFINESIDKFEYPVNTVDELEKQIEYWETVALNKSIAVTTENSEGRKYWVNRYKKLTTSLQEIKEDIIVPNLLEDK
ncbi:hypothetical protein [Tissierella sp. Yu-01]|uniref:hypothetical protein n=1 Tax=Tissierella sp. Yu-01 TaxID=3035694 RepID=UPI00240D4111|nr:hypothetical protein [Tissierella sp. Yu-01]WFA09277.1 hypothetical protein P3962_01510 [Tissierella sp. Yu-01]